MIIMSNASRLLRRVALAGVVALTAAGCKMDVVNPGVIDATTFDPSQDAATLSLSAQSNLYRAYGVLLYWSGYFSTEVWPGVARVEPQDIARRVAPMANADVPIAWANLQQALATNELAIPVLLKGANDAADIYLARRYLNAGLLSAR